MILVHDDFPRTTWKMAVIEDLIVGQDGLTRAAMIRTANGTTSRPITRLYPLEVTAEQDDHTVEGTKENFEQPVSDPMREDGRPKRASARRAAEQLKNWANILFGPPEDVATAEL